jgi:deoxycytidylate deaminase
MPTPMQSMCDSGGYSLLDGIRLYGWKPDPSLSADDNLMDLTLLVTRTSKLKQGSMACLLVRQGYDNIINNADNCGHEKTSTNVIKTTTETTNTDGDGKNGRGSMANATAATTSTFTSTSHKRIKDVRTSIISVATNRPLYRANDSDIHAEIAAITDAARCGQSTDQATAFITMPPCKRCLGALVGAGITKIVSRYKFNAQDVRSEACRKFNIEYVDIGKQRSEQCEIRVRTLINNHNRTIGGGGGDEDDTAGGDGSSDDRDHRKKRRTSDDG